MKLPILPVPLIFVAFHSQAQAQISNTIYLWLDDVPREADPKHDQVQMPDTGGNVAAETWQELAGIWMNTIIDR